MYIEVLMNTTSEELDARAIVGRIKQTSPEWYEFRLVREDGTVTTQQGNKTNISDIIQDFEYWLLGCGFSQNLVSSELHHDDCHKHIEANGMLYADCKTSRNTN